MPLTVESALITRKSADAEFNTDSINASGKTWPRETVHSEKGIKAIGVGKDVPYYVLAGSPAKGTAESAADLFRSCTDIFEPDMSNCSAVISEFFVSFAKVLNEAGFESSNCDMAILCGHKSTVYLAKCGNAKLYKYSDGELTEAVPQLFDFADGKSSYGVCAFRSIKPEDIFIIINSSVASVLPVDLLSAIAKSAQGDIKKLVSLISFQADKYGCKGAMSAIVTKVTEVEEETVVSDAPVVTEAPEVIPSEAGELPSAESLAETAQPQENEASLPEDDKATKGKKVILGIVVAIFLMLLVALSFMATKSIIDNRKDKETTSSDVTTTEKESTTQRETTTQQETTTEKESTTEETTTKRSEPSTKKPEPSTKKPDPTTEKPTEPTEPDPTEPTEPDPNEPTDPTEPDSTDPTDSTDPPEPSQSTEGGESGEESGEE